MYRVCVLTDGVEYPLHEPRDSDGELQLFNPVVTLEMGKNGSFKFRIAPTHPHKDKIRPLKSELSVHDDDDLLFRGRPIGDEGDFWRVGAVTCEGELAYLIDSVQRPYTFTGSTEEFIRQLISAHNSQVGAGKQFAVGNVTVVDRVPEVDRKCGECKNTLKTMSEQLIGRNDGYLRVRTEEGIRYLDYVSDYGGINSQGIRFGENLVDLTSLIKPTSIITALIPRGAEIESGDTESDVKAYVDITSVNDGLDYIYNQSGVDAYGWIWGSQSFDDATDAETLLHKARVYLAESVVLPETLELTAVDLGLLDVDMEKLKIGHWTNVESAPHGISKRLLLSKKEIHLDDPGKDKAVLGVVRPKFTASTSKGQAAISDRIDRVAASTSKEINRKIENATQLITGGKGGYVVLDVYDPDTGKKMHPWRILIMNTPDKETATNVIQINQNGIGFSTTGINGPYANAWTIDGNLVADFITAGTMLADRIRGGILELGGTGLGKDGRLLIKNEHDDKIGYWDKTGLHVELGEISGSTIRGSEIIGGTINIGEDTFTVDEDGAVVIQSGNIDLGPIKANDTYVDIGGFRISSSNMGAIFSTDSGRTLQIWSSIDEFENGPAIKLEKNGYKTRLGYGGLETNDVTLGRLRDEYGRTWESVSENIIELWNRLIQVEDTVFQ